MGGCTSQVSVEDNVDSIDGYLEAVNEVLEISLSEFCEITGAHKTVVQVDSSEDTLDAFQIFLKKYLRCAPVYNQEKKQYEGLLDTRDIIKYAVAKYCTYTTVEPIFDKKKSGNIVNLFEKKKSVIEKKNLEAGQSNGSMLQVLIPDRESFVDLLYLSKMRPFKILKYSDTLRTAIEILSNSHHLLGIRDQDHGPVDRVLGQRDIIHYLAQQPHPHNFPIEEFMRLSYCNFDVKMFDVNIKTLDIFKYLDEVGHSSVLISKEDIPYTVVSSTDVCIWLESLNSDVDLLEQTIETFIAEKGANCVVDCHCSESFTKILDRMRRASIHRVFIRAENSNNEFESCFSCSDFFKYLSRTNAYDLERYASGVHKRKSGEYASTFMGSPDNFMMNVDSKQHNSSRNISEKSKRSAMNSSSAPQRFSNSIPGEDYEEPAKTSFEKRNSFEFFRRNSMEMDEKITIKTEFEQGINSRTLEKRNSIDHVEKGQIIKVHDHRPVFPKSQSSSPRRRPQFRVIKTSMTPLKTAVMRPLTPIVLSSSMQSDSGQPSILDEDPFPEYYSTEETFKTGSYLDVLNPDGGLGTLMEDEGAEIFE